MELSESRLVVALVSAVFTGPDGGARLAESLAAARARGAELALLPELPLDPWWPASDVATDEAAEEPGGARHERLASAARDAGIAVVGGAIVRAGGVRRSTALLFDADGELVTSYSKVHLPDEPGFRETAHYAPGDAPPEPVRAPGGLPLGLQICSDLQRPFGSELLAARGAAAILHPRATEQQTWPRWKRVLVAAAQTSACWIASVNRPGPESGIGGPSLVVRPDGEVEVESEVPLVVAELDGAAAERARAAYPGYLDRPAALYARAWRDL